ncbi:HK97 gp10 family phage protein [uncultured Leuconostoc sp.]|uniref:HK97 gp10 family phage protein n=1 Tax=uncultured Leuconostoc sp. TaxID=173262 RepID=UPI0025EBE01F|nr:HK97 gp10 family phage protein [uncultured Leuconostoc sp.]
MGSFGKFDTKDFDAFVSEFENKIRGETIVKEIEAALSQTAGMTVNKVEKKTPVAKVGGGTLRRNWEASATKYFGNTFMVNIYNDTEYAAHVEYGHRIVRGGKTVGKQPGVFMLRDAMLEVDRNWDKLVGKRFLKAIDNILGG